MENNNNYIKKLYVQAKRRGTIEVDLILGYLADNFLAKMSEAELATFAEFLEEDDILILKWINNKEAYPNKYNAIFNLIKTYKKDS